ncbi:MAG: TIGR02117 family protein [Allosphingosinicella sp.]|uniref:TIGR02117 family protein n=1 Tax=Allosphingosinicella sp. TaxID=2823234 RepID=UPI00395C9DAE
MDAVEPEKPKRRPRRWLRGLLLAVATFLSLPLVYLLAAAILGAIPANAGWREPEEGVTIFIRTNGVHTWILMPKVSEQMDWSATIPPEHLADPHYGYGDHAAFGYGNREFYLNTPTWGDLTLHNALAAGFGAGPTLLHVEHDHRPAPAAHQRPLRLRPEEFGRLVAFVEASFRRDAAGASMPVLGRGYNDWDMFYEANGHYSLLLTCNEWTGRALRAAGVRTGLWTPLEQSIMWRLDRAE